MISPDEAAAFAQIAANQHARPLWVRTVLVPEARHAGASGTTWLIRIAIVLEPGHTAETQSRDMYAAAVSDIINAAFQGRAWVVSACFRVPQPDTYGGGCQL